jgi:hypothetical protein
VALGAAAAALLAGCGDDDPSSPRPVEISDLVGAWTVSKYEFSARPAGTPTYDLVADEGNTISLVVAADGRYEGTITSSGGSEEFGGTIEIVGETVEVTNDAFPGETEVFDLDMDDDTATLTDDGATFDFDGDDQLEPATLVIVFNRD